MPRSSSGVNRSSRGPGRCGAPRCGHVYRLQSQRGFFLCAALVYVDLQAVGFGLGPAKRTGIDASAVFWHFLDMMWLCLMGLFYLLG
jgi:hypothetical protein